MSSTTKIELSPSYEVPNKFEPEKFVILNSDDFFEKDLFEKEIYEKSNSIPVSRSSTLPNEENDDKIEKISNTDVKKISTVPEESTKIDIDNFFSSSEEEDNCFLFTIKVNEIGKDKDAEKGLEKFITYEHNSTALIENQEKESLLYLQNLEELEPKIKQESNELGYPIYPINNFPFKITEEPEHELPAKDFNKEKKESSSLLRILTLATETIETTFTSSADSDKEKYFPNYLYHFSFLYHQPS